MNASSCSRREILAGNSGCPNFVRGRCLACLRAAIQTDDNESSPGPVAKDVRRNIDWAAKTAARLQKSDQHSS